MTDRGVTRRDKVLPDSSSVSGALKLVAMDCGLSSDAACDAWVGVVAPSWSVTVMLDMRFIALVTLWALSDPNMRLPRFEKFKLSMKSSSTMLSVGIATPRGEYSLPEGSGVGMAGNVCVCVAGEFGG